MFYYANQNMYESWTLTETSSQALDALSTVLRDYLTNFTKLLRNNYDLALENGGTAFTDVLDQSLHQSGVEGKRGLDKYWQDSVKGLFRYLEDEVCESTHELLRLSVSEKSVVSLSVYMIIPGFIVESFIPTKVIDTMNNALYLWGFRACSHFYLSTNYFRPESRSFCVAC